MSRHSALVEQRALIVEAIRTGRPVPCRAEVAAFVDSALAATEARMRHAAISARKRSARIEAGILLAFRTALHSDGKGDALLDRLADLSPGQVQDEVLQWIEMQGPEYFGLSTVPDIETLRRVLRVKGVQAGRKRG